MQYNYTSLGKIAGKNNTTVRNRLKSKRFAVLFPTVTIELQYFAGTQRIQQTVITVPDELLENVCAYINTRPNVQDWEFKGNKTGRPRIKPKKEGVAKMGRPRSYIRDEKGRIIGNNKKD